MLNISIVWGTLVLAFFLLPSATCAATVPKISHEDAKHIIETYLETARFGVQVGGPFDVVPDKLGGLPNSIMQSAYEDAKHWERTGLVQVDELPRSARARYRQVTIEPTKLGLQFGEIRPPGDSLTLRIGTYELQKILQEEHIRLGNDDYLVLSFTYDATPNEFYAKYLSEAGENYSRHRKGRMLLKYDPALATWSPLTADHADIDGDFDTKTVADFLKCLRDGSC